MASDMIHSDESEAVLAFAQTVLQKSMEAASRADVCADCFLGDLVTLALANVILRADMLEGSDEEVDTRVERLFENVCSLAFSRAHDLREHGDKWAPGDKTVAPSVH